ncbi:unnamed protein product [Chilo suppressalis]|nr:unnamed protein product [Chilo suppressalis]
MRTATIALFRVLLDFHHNDRIKYEKLLDWARHNINSDMLDYAKRLVTLISEDNIEEKFLPPFIAKPNFFVNGETILKALYVKRNKGKISDDVMNIYQIYDIDNNIIAINANYSQWNGPFDACDKNIKYFTEDVALNSYYYGLHLLHPFWMSNEELSELNPRHAEHYYFAHRQLYARYLLEKNHLDTSLKLQDETCTFDNCPYLYYENGLPFPTRSYLIGQDIKYDVAYLKSIDTAIKECILREMVVMENGTYIRIDDDNYIDLLAKLIRANFDGIKAAKVIRSLFGYGYNGYPSDKANPSPSLLNHPQTTLRDPVYWILIREGLGYFLKYTDKTEPLNISTYETDEFFISDANFSRLATNFDYFLFNLYNSLESDPLNSTVKPSLNIFARQRRLNNEPFILNFTIESKTQKEVSISLFLGPNCNLGTCHEMYIRFFQLDCYRHKLREGINRVTWTPDMSSRYNDYDEKKLVDFNKETNYDIFKFPKNLIIPKGTEQGLNLTLFIMVLDEKELSDVSSNFRKYNKIIREVDTKPLGFPFHRKVDIFNGSASNYRFFNITIFHDHSYPDNTGFFSSYLY